MAPSGAGPRRRIFVSRFGEKLDSSRALHPPFASRCFVGGIPPPCLVRAWCRITRTVVSPFPCARSSHASPCPDLPLRRVFFRSICARRCPIDSLNLIRDKIAVWLISAWQFRYNMTQSRCKQGKRRKTTKWAIKTATQKGCLPIWPMRMPLMA